MMKTLLLLITILMTMSLSVAYADNTLEPGLWKTTISMQMSNMPFAPAARSYQKCITTETADATIQALAEETLGPDCELADYTFDGATGYWSTTCLGRHSSTSKNYLEIIDSRHYQLKSDVTLADTGGGIMKVTSQFEHLGDCK